MGQKWKWKKWEKARNGRLSNSLHRNSFIMQVRKRSEGLGLRASFHVMSCEMLADVTGNLKSYTV